MSHWRRGRPPKERTAHLARHPALLLLLSAIVQSAAPAAHAQQLGNFCVRDFQSGAVCTANDVRIQALILRSIIETCDGGVVGEAEASFDMFISALGSPERYDIGLFLALDGGSARDGDSCFHDFLQPPLTPDPTMVNPVGGPWLNADADGCGDIGAGTELFKPVTLRVACVDRNGDGTVDVSACASWDNNQPALVCSSVADAFPGTNSKCGCHVLETGIPMGIGPTPSPSPSPSPSPVPTLPPGALMALAAFLVVIGFLLLRRRPARHG